MKLWSRLITMAGLTILATTSVFAASPPSANQSSQSVGEQGGNLVIESGTSSGTGGSTPGALAGPIPKRPSPPSVRPYDKYPPKPALSGQGGQTGQASSSTMPPSDLGQSTLGGVEEDVVELNPNQVATGVGAKGDQAPPQPK